LVVLFLILIFLGTTNSNSVSESSSAQSIADTWPMFHHDLSHTGNSNSTAPSTNQTLWRFNTGGPVDSPVVSGGLVYIGSLDDNVYALNASDGSLVWKYKTGGNVLSPAAVADGKVYVGSEDNKVYALNATTGAYIWSYKTDGIVISSPAVAGSVVYVGSYDHLVYAFGSPPNAQNYTVVFTASGLPSGTSWTITLNSQVQSSTSNSIIFSVPSGVYEFSVTSPTGYTASPSSGTITVNGADVNEIVTFTSTIPKLPSPLVLLLIVMAILLAVVLLAVVLYRRKH
jgi:outer membrane protein assembly factor BamB